MKEIIIILLCIILTALIIVICYGGNYLYNLGINPKHPKDLIFKSNTDEETKQSETSGVSTIDSKTWLLKYSNYEDLFINSKDNLKLHNFLIKNENKSNKWVIAVHGYTSQGTYMASYAQNFYDMGYNIIIPDLRGHGKSEGTYIGMGWDERFDIIDLINYINDNFKDSQIVLFGVSMGAATVMSTSGEKLPSNVKAIIEDCGYTSTWSQFAYQLKALFKLPSFPMMHTASIICKLRSGYFISEASPIKQIKNSITPTLFIHGDKDSFVPFFMLDELYNASPVEKEKLIIPGAKHARASYVNPKLYWETVENFLEKYIN
ncbi:MULTISPECIES: alpha/beta hydrolase [unclassified Clostridium]|uniref:alpha/beta hydrolase n=1 Tax=Clostridium TaxID=1485 RepID=UPI001C8B803A|nr:MULTISPECIES: alpha/beta hydrolase [unclassified Clostridium]MBX9138599.1 alpha/beta hydrolase [Clostridium sp. K12(2020)]MBX9145329.1 alpha/beta hydrolase [Clostridium sp. K13]MDU2290020.1 alpha/beta hydrolase [Clostridium celatum]